MKNCSILKNNEPRVKYCEICKKDFSTLYIIQYKAVKQWFFTCEKCLETVKKDNTFYRYGGTWKK